MLLLLLLVVVVVVVFAMNRYHVLGAMRLAAMHLARRRCLSEGLAVPDRLQRKLTAFTKLVRPADLPEEVRRMDDELRWYQRCFWLHLCMPSPTRSCFCSFHWRW